MSLQRVVQLVSLLIYCALAGAAVRFWLRQRVRAAVWLVATFAILAVLALVAVAVPHGVDLHTSGRLGAGRLAIDLVVTVLIVFPYLLHRFVRALADRVTVSGRTLDATMAALILWTLLLPRFPAAGEVQPGWYRPYRVAFVLWWVGVLVGVGVSLWRAGNGQPGVARRRVRIMAAASLSLSIAVVVSSGGQSGSTYAQTAMLMSAVLGWLSAAGFMIGFMPPPSLRRAWRAEDEARLRRSSAAVATASSPTEAAALIVEPVSAMLGGLSAVILDSQGQLLATSGPGLADPLDEGPDRIVIVGRRSRLVVGRSGLTPLFGADEELLVRSIGAYLDVSLERIAAFEASETARRDALRASEELQQLVYGISHDLKNPLHTVMGFLKLLEPETPRLSAEGQIFWGRIEASATYMARLIDDLLRLSRVGHTDASRAPIALGELVEDIANDIHERYEGVTVSCQADCVLWMNPVRARQLFTNLIENAARHGGRRPLLVRVVTGPREGQLQEILVEDDGVGIPVEFREKVFALFERLEGFSTSEGTGVGLAMSRRIAQDVGGAIEVADASSGTRFRLLLPLLTDLESDPRPDGVSVQHA